MQPFRQSIPWALAVLFSAVSVHSFFFNHASHPVFDVTGSVVASVGQGLRTGDEYPTVENVAGAVVGESSLRGATGSEGDGQPDPLILSVMVDETPDAPVNDTLLPIASKLAEPATDEVEPGLSAEEFSAIEQRDLVAQSDRTLILEQISKQTGTVPRFVSPRPPVRPATLEAALEQTRKTTLGEQESLASPLFFSIRPAARPSALMTHAPSPLAPSQAVQVDPLTPVEAEALRLGQAEDEASGMRGTQRSSRMPELATARLGTVLGLFETNTRRWALVESFSGSIVILEPGDAIGSGFVASISNGTMVVIQEGSFSEYNIGDNL
jgi:hypothetical protein